MITLFRKEILSKLNQSKAFQTLYSHVKLEKYPLLLEGIRNGLYPFIISSLHLRSAGPALIITSSEKEAENLYEDLSNIYENKIYNYPWWGVAPYKEVAPVSSVFAERAEVLTGLLSGEQPIIVASLRAISSPVPPPEYIKDKIFSFKKGDLLDLAETALILQKMGYLRVPRVSVKGEFALRGEVIDIFVPGSDEAVRLVVEFDEIESIKSFNPITQGSTGEMDHITLFPVREVIFEEPLLAVLEKNLIEAGLPQKVVEGFLERLRANPELDGGELFFPLCFDKNYSFFDYLTPNTTIYTTGTVKLEHSFSVIEREFRELYKKAMVKKNMVPPPEKLLLDYRTGMEPFRKKILLGELKKEVYGVEKLNFACDPPRSFFGNITYFKEELAALLKVGYKVYIFAVYEYQAERIKGMLKDFDVNILPCGLSEGFCIPELKLIFISENEIFGRKKRLPQSVKKAKSRIIDSFVDLSPGDSIVHINYGIGRFKGIQRVKTTVNEKDYIQLEYADEEMIFIPIEQVNLIQKYVSTGGKEPKLDKIGGKSWESRRAKVKKSVEELAGMLVVLYSKRRKARGFAFSADTEWQTEFEALFPYEETEDQLKCIQDVKADMESPQPMDRLVCGDVGYGKTEVALRAAFKGVMGGKQVALLAPTTILVEQHYEKFLERFEKFPVNIGMLSRFRSKKEQKEVLVGIKEGKIDLIIGTHRLIQKDVIFKELGLIIVDEEQRFGVKHKERLKELKTNVDSLTLTATPIPRTLHMSLTKIRDMSIINTPPQNRLPIETIIEGFNEEIVAKAIRREVERGGQVFYLHNRVRTIMEVHQFLQKLLPEVMVDVAHGKMGPTELEDVMHRFIHNEFQVLVSTTIIENGIDIPNVNTIIIDRADMYGVSQLYQLRGRVGRSGEVAYAYLLYPENRVLSEIAMKRLRIISDYTELGSGFKIALKDLEIRGAGNVLGREQSGDILSVGFDMYIKLLEDALAELQTENKEEIHHEEAVLELEYSGFIPDDYISDPMEKMEVYKKIAAITSNEELERIYGEVLDRFGPMPDSVASIISIAEIRIICRKLYVAALKERGGNVEIEFAQLSRISVDKVLRLINESGGKVFLNTKKPNCLFMKVGKIGLSEKSEFIRDRLSRLLKEGS